MKKARKQQAIVAWGPLQPWDKPVWWEYLDWLQANNPELLALLLKKGNPALEKHLRKKVEWWLLRGDDLEASGLDRTEAEMEASKELMPYLERGDQESLDNPLPPLLLAQLERFKASHQE
jgi:hypothetical protein